MLLVLAIASIPLLHDWSQVRLMGWTRDGSAVAWEAPVHSLEKPDGVLPCERVFMIVADPDGRPLRVYRRSSRVPMDEVTWIDPGTDSLWKSALGEQEAQRWLDSHRLVPVGASRKLGGALEDASGREKLVARVRLEGRGCRSATLEVSVGAARAGVARDDCPADGDARGDPTSALQIGWSPDGRHAALAWNTRRPARGSDEVDRGHFAVVSRKTLAGVEVLAPTAALADSLAARIERAGFTVARRGAAPASGGPGVSYASGFQAEAREIARIIGVGESSVRAAAGRPAYPLRVVVTGLRSPRR